MSKRLASGAQLWVLNSAGHLKIVDESEPITAPTAFELVAAIKADEETKLDD